MRDDNEKRDNKNGDERQQMIVRMVMMLVITKMALPKMYHLKKGFKDLLVREKTREIRKKRNGKLSTFSTS